MATTIPTAPTWNTTGNWNKKYLDPNTDSATATKLYNTYGSRYNWMPLNQRLDASYGKAAEPSPAVSVSPTPTTPQTLPTPQTPTATTPANSAQLFPFLSMGQATTKPVTIPKFQYSQQSAQNTANQNTNVGSVASYIPKQSADPTYKFQLEEGQRALDAKLAAQGLTGSGAELEANRRMVADLTSQQAQRAVDMAKSDQSTLAGLAGQKLDYLNSNLQANVNRYGQDIAGGNLSAAVDSDAWKQRQLEAERLNNMQLNESQRLERVGNTDWSRLMDQLNFLQAGDPSAMGQNASESLASLYEKMGPQLVQYAMAMR